jgi:DNA modification methylase
VALLASAISKRGRDRKGPRLAIIYRSIDQLRLSSDNPRIHSDKQVRQIARSIEEFGFIVPILVDHQLRVVAGHGRYQAGRLLGLNEVPTVSLEHLTEVQSQAFRIADNRLTENAEWSHKLLAGQLKALAEADLDFSVDITGFEVGEIDVLIEGLSPASGELDPADVLPETTASTQVTKSGDLWLLGRHRVYCGNSLNERSFLSLMQGRHAAMVITDPPYNRSVNQVTGLGPIRHQNFKMAAGEMSEYEFSDFLAQVCNLLAKYSVDGSVHFLFMDWRHIGEILLAGKQVYSEFKNLCVWTKDNAGMGSLYRSQHELVFVFKNGKDAHCNNVQLGQYGRYRTNVWAYAGINSFSRTTEEGNLLELHPTVKPAAMIADAIMDCSARGDIVVDCFVGSGSTIIAAERTGRICYGIEIDPTYVDTSVRRWQAFTGLSATHGISGLSFAELEQEAANELKQ